jgi:PAS domain S-box-containing protein
MTESTEVLAVLPVAVYTTDPDGKITYFNEAAANLWGHRPEIGTDRWCGSWKLWWADGRALPHDECPMAIMLKEGRSMPGIEAVAERPDGTRVPFAPYPTLLRDAEGKVKGAINVLVDISDRQNAHMHAERVAAIVASSDDAIISKDLNGIVTSWNEGATRIFGYGADEMVGQSILRLIPERLHAEEAGILARLKAGDRIDHFDTERVTKSGQIVQVSLTVSPIRDLSGRIVGASKVARDVTARKRDETFQRLLVEELNHRVKNTLAIVQSLAGQSLRKSKDADHFVESFNGRVQALARAHDLLVKRRMSGSTLGELIGQQVLLDAPDDGRVATGGPEVVVSGRDAVQLALVLHELATNARKYGALSLKHPNGKLDIRWTVKFRPLPRLELEWQESGVQGVASPNRQGFGSTLIERSLTGSGGWSKLSYAADGLHCSIALPLEDPNAGEFERAQAMPDRNAGKGRVLVVEDEMVIAMDIQDTLIATGFSVVGPAASVRAALDLIAREKVDVALLDANLGGSSVEEVAAALTRANIPFAFATGHQRDGLPASFASARLLAKPFSNADLIATMAELLAGRTPDAELPPDVVLLRPAQEPRR